MENDFRTQRTYLHSDLATLKSVIETKQTDRQKKLPAAPLQKEAAKDAVLIDLTQATESVIKEQNIFTCINNRRSRRTFVEKPLTIEELSFLLWATQGVQKISEKTTLRTVPSTGACHPLESYLIIFNVEGIKPGLYRYLALSHQLEFLREDPGVRQKVFEASDNQPHIKTATMMFVWTARPFRTEWAYHILAHKGILLDAGHVGQNLYLACEALGCGTVTCDWYFQEKFDQLLGLDGDNELVIYFASVGNLSS